MKSHDFLGTNKFSIENLIPNPCTESIEAFIKDFIRVSMLELSKTASGEHDENISKEIKKYFRRAFAVGLKNSSLRECRCNNDAHHRFIKDNSRRKLENAIIDRITQFPDSKNITLLSLGSGELLQDLIIVFRLTLLGYKNINLVCVDPEFDHEKIGEFLVIMEALNQYCEMNTICNFFNKVDDIPEELRDFDVVYAIDYDNLECGNDYSSRQLPERTGSFKDKPYLAAIAMLKACSFLNTNINSFAAFSQHAYLSIFSKNLAGLPSENNIENVVFHPNHFQQYCINSSLEVLLLHFAFFIKEKKQLFINDEIMPADHKPYIEILLQKFNIPYSFFTYADCLNQANNIGNNKFILVVDWIAFNTKLNDTINVPGFEADNFSIIRVNWMNRHSAELSCPLQKKLDELCTAGFPWIKAIFKENFETIKSLGFEEAQKTINMWKESGITKILLGKLLIEKIKKLSMGNDLVAELLTKRCTVSNFVLFDKTIQLHGYLANLLMMNDRDATFKAKDIIFCLQNNDFAGIEQYLNSETDKTGLQLWSQLSSLIPATVNNSMNKITLTNSVEEI